MSKEEIENRDKELYELFEFNPHAAGRSYTIMEITGFVSYIEYARGATNDAPELKLCLGYSTTFPELSVKIKTMSPDIDEHFNDFLVDPSNVVGLVAGYMIDKGYMKESDIIKSE